MSPSSRPGTGGALAGAALVGLVLVGASVALGLQSREDFRDSPFLRVDPERIVLSERDSRVPCGECHEAEYEVWVETPHATGFNTLHRTESARGILRAMDLRVTKRQESLCMRCHYTVKAPELEAIAGVSCESCHGPARDWMDVHNDWGSGVDHPDSEDPAHREQRLERSVAGGMLRPSGDLYAVAANCFECHTVPMEELVNVGGHKAGSGSFDLVKWSEQIRHNFVHRQWGGEGGNREPDPSRTRAMLLVDRILKYEFGVRAMAAAREQGDYQKAVERRTTDAYRELDAITRIVDVPGLAQILAVGADLELVPGNEGPLTAAADRIRELARSFTPELESMDLAGLDPLLQGAPAHVVAARAAGPAPPPAPGPAPAGEEAAVEASSDPAGEAAAAGASADPAGDAASPSAPAPSDAAPAAPTAPPELPGRVRSRPEWFTDTGHGYYDSPDCGGCHEGAAEWIHGDPHGQSNAALFNQTPEARGIATLYGIGVEGMTKGDQICMSCHGTAKTATAVDVWDPVTCESCHGPAADYYKPHRRGGNPQLGMRSLKDASARAQNCSRCHHVTDARLLAAGHPSGEGYDLARATDAIRHWPDDENLERSGPYPEVGASALASAWSAAVSSRPVPAVTVASLPTRPTAPSRPAGEASRPPAPSGGDASGREGAPPSAGGPAPAAASTAPARPAASTRPAPRPAPVRSVPPRPPATLPARATSPDGPVELEPFPEATEELGTEELLRLVQSRLETLYRLLGRGG